MPRRPGSGPLPPPQEMACMAALWALGSGSVHDVAEALAPRTPLAYTTVMTLLERLLRRGHVERQKQGRRFIYSPAQDRNGLREVAVRELVGTYFGGSREALRSWLDTQVPVPEAEPEPERVSIDTALL